MTALQHRCTPIHQPWPASFSTAKNSNNTTKHHQRLLDQHLCHSNSPPVFANENKQSVIDSSDCIYGTRKWNSATVTALSSAIITSISQQILTALWQQCPMLFQAKLTERTVTDNQFLEWGPSHSHCDYHLKLNHFRFNNHKFWAITSHNFCVLWYEMPPFLVILSAITES